MTSYEEAVRRHVQQHGPHPVPPPPQSIKRGTIKRVIIKQESVTRSRSPRRATSRLSDFSIGHVILAALVFGLIGYAYRRAFQPSALCFPVEDLLNSTYEAGNTHELLAAQPDKLVNAFPHATLPRLQAFKDAGLKAANSIGDLTPQSLGLRDPPDSQLLAKLSAVFSKLQDARDIGRDIEIKLERQRTVAQQTVNNNALMAQKALRGGSVSQEDAARSSAEYKANKEWLELSGRVLRVISSGVSVFEHEISRFIAFESCLKDHVLEEVAFQKPGLEQRARHCLIRVFGPPTGTCY
ncbi:hypothetical protein KCU78_g4941, partial [Aureobasidium melanogenum]